MTLPVSEVARDRNDDTPLWGEVGALVVLLFMSVRKVIGAVGGSGGGPVNALLLFAPFSYLPGMTSWQTMALLL